ncbi:MAG: START domain-containing protein [Saprospiraceae bacterium]|nr:START domain-containing protein [Saprospiraceae bacterium]
MNATNFFWFLIAGLIPISVDVGNSHHWKLIRKSDSIRVYTGSGEHRYKAVRIEAVINVPLNEFVDFINDVAKYPLWVYKCSQSLTLETPAGASVKYWMVSDFPFPFKDRELTVVSEQAFDADGIYHSRSVAKPAFDGRDQNVVITKFESKWIVMPLGRERIKIDYEMMTEPGGNIPAWLYNLAVHKGPFYTMNHLKQILERT